MSRLLQITLSCLLALALPLQGFAAQAGLIRCITHQDDQALHQHESHVFGDGAVAASQPDAVCCDEAAVKDAAKNGSTHSKCNASSPCCETLAITAQMPLIHALSHRMTLVTSVEIAYEYVFARGIERPPRTALA
jgi:hypothetical protein